MPLYLMAFTCKRVESGVRKESVHTRERARECARECARERESVRERAHARDVHATRRRERMHAHERAYTRAHKRERIRESECARERTQERESARERASATQQACERESAHHHRPYPSPHTIHCHCDHLERLDCCLRRQPQLGRQLERQQVASRGAGAVDIIGRSIAQFGGTLQGLASISLVSASSWCMHKVGGEMASEVSEASEVVDATGADARAAAAAVASGSGMILRQLIVVLHRDGATRTKSSFFSVFKLDVWSGVLTEKPGKPAGKPGKAGKRMGNGPETPEIVWKRCRN